jgi:hypothetical protein
VGPIQAHGREDVAACFHRFFADFDTVQLMESADEAVADRLLIHYRLTRGQPTRCAPRPRSASLWSFQPRIAAAAQNRAGASATTITHESMLSATERVGTTFAAEP